MQLRCNPSNPQRVIGVILDKNQDSLVLTCIGLILVWLQFMGFFFENIEWLEEDQLICRWKWTDSYCSRSCSLLITTMKWSSNSSQYTKLS